jgi:glycosyltransferase involved in cell wall biosynthesis
MLQLIEAFKSANFEIVFASPAQKGVNAIDLGVIGVEEQPIKINSDNFDDFIKTLQPDIVLFDRFMMEEQFGWRVAEQCPNAIRILDTEDLHFLRKVRHQLVKKNQEFSNEALMNSVDAKRENAAILRCDLSLIISSFEMELLTDVFKVDKNILLYLPFMLKEITNEDESKWLSFSQRNDFVFIGNFFHKPNVDAVLTLKKIWRNIKKELPKANLYIYGAYVNQQIQQLHKPEEGFFIKGFVEDARKVVSEARVVLAPIRFGAGIKGKLTEAMLCGTPSVTTIIGAEGMHADLPWNGFVADLGNDFAEKAVVLYSEKNVWEMAQKNGIAIINSIYNKEVLESSFIDRINVVMKNLKSHRTRNFMGALLQHHTVQSTKYMSKWIQEKNQKKD